MSEDTQIFPPDLSQLARKDWLNALRKIGEARGFAEPLGSGHAAVFVEEGDTLLVTFEAIPKIHSESDTRTPFGFDMVQSHGWSCLTVMSHGDTWFRDPSVVGFFDQLLDDGFFDEFENVIFYGQGSCGYAAAAYSVSSPGAKVVMLAPHATLDPRVTEWEDRFIEHRRLDFTSRYGFAPDMIDAAHRAYVFYDPLVRKDAMHSALFERRNVDRYRMTALGSDLQQDLIEMDILPALLEAAAENKLDAALVSALWRRRRDYPAYLQKLLKQFDSQDQPYRALALCQNVTDRMHAPRMKRRLAALKTRLGIEDGA